MSTNVYQVGDKVRLSAAFTDIDGDAQDPGGVEFKIRKPDGTVAAYTYGTDAELVKTATGAYYVDWLITAAGRYRWRMAGITSGQAADERTFRVEPSGLD